MWYTTPAALAIIARITAKPPVEMYERRYVLTADRWYEFTGAEYEALHHLHANAIRAADHDDRLRADVLQTSAEDVIGALWGDPGGNQYFRTDRDHSRSWARIREEIAAALNARAAA